MEIFNGITFLIRFVNSCCKICLMGYFDQICMHGIVYELYPKSRLSEQWIYFTYMIPKHLKLAFNIATIVYC